MNISAILPTKNRPIDTKLAVQSVLEQIKLPYELIIIDQSHDETTKNNVYAAVKEHHSDIKLNYVHDQTINGLVAAKQRGVEIATGDIILFLEDDIVLEKDYIAEVMSAFLENPTIVGTCGVIKETPNSGLFYLFFHRIFHCGLFRDPRTKIHGKKGLKRGQLIPSAFLSGGTSAYRSAVFDKVKFDVKNEFFMLEDIDFSLRVAREFGKDRLFINTSAQLHHSLSTTNRSNFKLSYTNKVRETICFYKKHKRNLIDLLSLTWLYIGFVSQAITKSIIYRDSNPIRGTIQGLYLGIRYKVNKEQ